MDIAGPEEVESVGGKRYMLVIADDYSRYYHAILLRSKSDAFEAARDWIVLQERRTGCKVKRIRSDNGGEFVSEQWHQYYRENGILHERTVPYSPEQNGKAERAVRILKDGIRTYLLDSGLSRGYWGAAAMSFAHIRNMIPTKYAPDTTPHELFLGKRADVSRLRTFGCVAYVHIPKQRRQGAWAPRARRLVFVGYADQDGSKAWVFYDPEKKERIVSLHAEFWEDTLWASKSATVKDQPVFPEPIEKTQPANTTDLETSQADEEDVIEIVRQEEGSVPARRSARLRDLRNNVNAVTSPAIQEIASLLALDEHQPVLDEILYRVFLAAGEQNPNDARFLDAKRKELASMHENNVWELVPLPPGERAIACRWLCTDKMLADLSTMEKARLIVLGHLQRAGLDYQEIFAPVLKMESVRMLLALITKFDM